MTPAFVTKLLFACALGYLLALPAPSIAADACPLLRAQTDAPTVATRIAAAACEEHQLWYRPFIDLDGRYAGSRVREAEAGLPVKELCRKHGFSEASYYLWRSKFGGMSVPDAKRLKELETENGRLKKLLAEQVLENEVIKDVLRKKW